MKQQWEALVFENRRFGERAALLLASCGLFAFTLFVFGPIGIYLNNVGEFWFQLSQFWWIMALLGLAVFAVLFGLGCLLRGKLFNIYVTALFSVAVVLYLQGNFLNISYGELNGEQVNWSRYGGYAIKNFLLVSLIAIVPFVIHYFHKAFWRGMIRFVSALIVGVQVVAIIAGLIAAGRPERSEMALGWAGVNAYSKEQNLVLIVMDALDEPYFTEYLALHPELTGQLDGFTYYPNTAGVSMNTFFCMTPILTGRVFDYDPNSYDEYLKLAWENASLFTKLQAVDYDVRALAQQETYIGSVHEELFDNYIVGRRGIIDYKKFTRMMMELVCYTYLPHVFKAGFWLYPGEFNYLQDKVFYTDDDTEAYRHIQEAPVTDGSEKKTFRLYHLNALHEPFTLTSDAARRPDGGDTTPMEQAEGAFLIVNMLLEQMRLAGVYDCSTIILAADHANSAHVDSDALDTPLYSPVLLYKPAYASGAMRDSAAPVSVMDIRATFLDAAGLSHDAEGPSLTELMDGTERLRYFYRPSGSPRAFYEYSIDDADANDFANWTPTGRVFAPPDGGNALAEAPDGE